MRKCTKRTQQQGHTKPEKQRRGRKGKKWGEIKERTAPLGSLRAKSSHMLCANTRKAHSHKAIPSPRNPEEGENVRISRNIQTSIQSLWHNRNQCKTAWTGKTKALPSTLLETKVQLLPMRKRKNEGMEIHLTMSCLKNYNENQWIFFQPMRISCKDDKNQVRVSPASFDRSRQ